MPLIINLVIYIREMAFNAWLIKPNKELATYFSVSRNRKQHKKEN